MIVYVDVVILENIVMNYIILISVGILGKFKIHSFRILISSIFGSTYAIISIYIKNISWILNIMVGLIFSIIMIIIAFPKTKFKELYKKIILYYVSSFIFGGIAFAVSTQITVKVMNLSIISGIIGLCFIFITIKIILNRRKMKSMICNIKIFYNNKSIELKGFIDSGNMLKEPISKKDVIIVEKKSLKTLLDNKFLDDIDNILNGKWLPSNIKTNFILIPFYSLGKNNGIIIGFKPEYIEINYLDQIIRKEVIVGIYNERLNLNNNCNCLIGLNVLKEGFYLW